MAYPVFILRTLICRFMVRKKRMKKYMTRMGKKTGMLKASKHVRNIEMRTAFEALYLHETEPFGNKYYVDFIIFAQIV